MSIVQLTNKDYKDTVSAAGVTIVDFFADWCGPCKTYSPVVDQIAKDYEGQIKVYKVDAGTEMELAAAVEVSSLPTTIVLKDGIVQDKAVGAMPAVALKKLIESAL